MRLYLQSSTMQLRGPWFLLPSGSANILLAKLILELPLRATEASS